MKDPGTEYYCSGDFTSIKKIDAHVHINTENPAFIHQSEEDNFQLLTINVDVPYFSPIEEQQRLAVHHLNAFSQKIHYATSFTMKNWNSGDEWQEETIEYLKDSFSKGAIAVKVWKNIGMELRDSNGDFIMIDHPRFDAVFNYLENNNIPLIGHLGEPRNCWLPVEKMTVSGDKTYFKKHPEYHMYLHPEYPSYEDQINARDRMLKKHPGLKFIGAHLASLEWSVDELAKRLDQFPNMAVDMAARISHLQYQAVNNWQRIYDFFIKYQDRILYGTDIEADETKPSAEIKKHAHEIWLRHWNFFTTDELMKVPKVENEFKGLKLPKEVIDKIYRKNAENWFPGIRL